MDDALQSEIKALPGNDRCIDCGARHPSWAAVNLGALLCLNCAGVHRGLGVHVSFVRSLAMDKWSEKQLASMRAGGNMRLVEWLQEKGVAITDPPAVKYASDAAELYRLRLKAKVDGVDLPTALPAWPLAAVVPPVPFKASFPLTSTIVASSSRDLPTNLPALPRNGRALPIVCLHGMFESSLVFSQCEVPPWVVLVALDRPGYGPTGSWSTSPRKHSYEEFAKLALGTLTNLGFDKEFGVLGHSSGGPCALALAAAAGTRCVHCVLVASDPEYATANVPDPYNGMLPPAPSSDASPQELGLTTALELEMDEQGLFDDNLRASIAASEGQNGPLIDFALERQPWGIDLDKVTCEVDVLYGSEDPFFGIDHALFFATSSAEARLFPRQGYGHFDILLDQDAFAFVMDLFQDGTENVDDGSVLV